MTNRYYTWWRTGIHTCNSSISMSLNQILLCDLISSQVLLTVTLKFMKMVQSAGVKGFNIMIILIVQCVKSLTSTTPSPPWVTAWLWVVALWWTTLLNFFCVPCFSVGVSVIWRVQRWAGSFKRHNEHKLAKLQQQRFGIQNLFSFWNRVSFPFLSSHWFHFPVLCRKIFPVWNEKCIQWRSGGTVNQSMHCVNTA